MNEWKSATNSFRIHNRVVPLSARWPTLCPWSRCATLFTLQRCFSRRPTPPTTLLRSTWRPENLIGRMVTWLSPSSTQKKMVQQWLEARIVPFQKPFFISQSQLACDDEYFDSFSWAPAPKSSGNERQKAAKVCKYFFKKCAVMCKSHFEWLWPRPRGSDALVCIYQETRISAWRCYRLHRGYSLCHPKSDIQRTNWW